MAELDIRQHNIHILESLQDGDLIEFKRGFYSHWGVYAGNETVIHLTLDDVVSNFAREFWHGRMLSAFGALSNMFVVKSDNFFDVANGCPAEKNNQTDEILIPYWPDRIIQNAIDMIGKHEYNFLTQNCEHFAKYCRYGKAISEQVNDQVEVVCKGMTSITDVRIPISGMKQHYGLMRVYAYVAFTHKKEKKEKKRKKICTCKKKVKKCGKKFDKACVKREKFWKVEGGCKCYKNNSKDEKLRPKRAQEILKRGLVMCDKKIEYNVLWSNCEHFASFCRYGKLESEQADFAKKGILTSLVSGTLGFAAGAGFVLVQTRK